MKWPASLSWARDLPHGEPPRPGRVSAPSPTAPTNRSSSFRRGASNSRQRDQRVVGILGPTFLPGGEMLVTERPGRLRIVRNECSIRSRLPACVRRAQALAGLMDGTLHPKFSETRLVYLGARSRWEEAPVCAGPRTAGEYGSRRWRELFVADAVGKGPAAGNPIVFGRDGSTAMGVGGALDDAAQKTSSHFGKMVRLRDDGSAPPDNPFVGRPGSKPEIYTLGHRNMLGLAVHPVTGAIWENENGPLGGDEVNMLKRAWLWLTS